MTARLLLLCALAGCAPLNTSTMSETCRSIYDDCLSRCGDRSPAVAATAGTQLPPPPAPDPDVPNCTRQCNDEARDCR